MHNHAVLEEEERAYAPPEEIIPAVQVKPRASIPQRALFEDSLLDPSGQRGRRTRATLFSFILQSFLVVVLILMPLLYTDVLPTQQLVTFLIVAPPPPPPPPPAASAVVQVVKVMSDITNGQLRTPSRIPAEIQMIKEEEAPPPLNVTNGVVGGVPGGIPGGQLGGVIGGIISSTSRLAPVLPVAPKRLRISQGVSQGMLITKIEPVYPNLAKAARIQGAVVLTAIVSKEGAIENLQLVSGHPMLAPAAMEAVKRWRYRPYLLNGQPVEVETTITVTFRFQT